MTEAQIQYQILQAWGAHPCVRLWRQNTGVAQLGSRSVRFGVPGQGDITGLILPSGRRIEIECKSAAGRQSERQHLFGAMITRFGGLYILARTLADVDAALVPLVGAR
jgi:hypothetical protein